MQTLQQMRKSGRRRIHDEFQEIQTNVTRARHSPFPRPRRFRRLSNRTTARTINTTKRTAVRDAATITIVEESSLSPLLPSTPGAVDVTVESVHTD